MDNYLIMGLWLLMTLTIYSFSLFLYKLAKQSPLIHPLIVSSTLIIIAMTIFDTALADYQSYTTILSFLLGPATVALAVPLFLQFKLLVSMSWRVILPVIIGGVLAPFLSWLSLYALDGPFDLKMTMLVKSITTPLAMDTANAIGGIAALAAVIVISTGIVGALIGPSLFKVLKVHNHAAQGIALGTVAHAVGTSKAVSISEQCTAFATLGLCVNGLSTAIILPLLFA